MTHEKAFGLVCEICPAQAGLLWNTANHTGCDTAHAVADQYGDDMLEENAARADLELLANGQTPSGWEAHVPI